MQVITRRLKMFLKFKKIFDSFIKFSMSLSNIISHATRPAIPEALMAQINEDDKACVENTLYITLELIPTLSIALCTALKKKESYILNIPFSSQNNVISHHHLNEIVNFYPSRIQRVSVLTQPSSIEIEMFNTENRILHTQLDIIRVNKKSRRI